MNTPNRGVVGLLALTGAASAALAQGTSGSSGGPLDVIWVVGAVILGLVALIVFIFLLQFFNLYIQAYTSNAKVGMLDMVGMKLRKVDIRTVVINRIRAVKAGMDIPTNALETHYLAGGRVSNVVTALISARSAKIDLPWSTATAIDLAGRDILEAVHTSVNPKVIDCPAAVGPRSTIDAVARDGIQLKVKARVTVRTNIARLVGGATEETIIARVGQGIVSTIGSAHDHKAVLENPDDISKTVMKSGLDAGTAFEILSIDIADVDVGENIGAQLQAAQAEADKKRFQAEAEKRRALALALEQENKAKIEENQALVTLAQAEVPKAIAEAFRSGRLGVMDYYRLQNLQSDTSMRSSIAGDGPAKA
ncbi:hypothetical protein PHYC_02881 [Phycisphaerales bacterium]|nr:hypothetical protein PHYC_02881 [Phycisphaerales bacterium]